MLKNALPQRLVRLRSIRGLNQEETAAGCGVSRRTIIGLESGQIKDVKLSTIDRICAFFGVTPNELLGYDQDQDRFARRIIGIPTVRELRDGAHVCAQCNRRLRNGEEHIPRECLMYVQEDTGASEETLASRFGYDVEVVRLMLKIAYGRRVGKRRPYFDEG